MAGTDVVLRDLETLLATYQTNRAGGAVPLRPHEKAVCSRCNCERPIVWFYQQTALHPSQRESPGNAQPKQLKVCRTCREHSKAYRARQRRSRKAPEELDHRALDGMTVQGVRELLMEGYSYLETL